MDVRGGQRQANNSKSLHALHAASTQLGKITSVFYGETILNKLLLNVALTRLKKR